MRERKSSFRWGFALLAVALITVLAAESAEAGGRRRGGRRVVVPRASFGFYGAHYYSPFFNPYWGPHYYGRRGEGQQLNPAVARALKLGALDLNVKPRDADVFVDGTFVGKVRDFDGYPGYLWLEAGSRSVAIYKGGFATYEAQFGVAPGVVTELKLKLLAGASEPPPGP